MDISRIIGRFEQLEIEYKRECPLASYTSFRIGGPAAVAVFPKTAEEVSSAFGIISENGARYTVIGNGTNLLVDDRGFDGVAVILSGLNGFEYKRVDGGAIITACAGYSITRLASEAAKLSLTGFEFAYGIPGTVGGGVYMNAGAYGGSVSDIIVGSRWLDPLTGEIGVSDRKGQGHSYRHSAYMDNGRIILSADFRLDFGDRDGINSLMNELASRRREKQPLEYPSAGSVFKRGNNFFTAELIEKAGLKGKRIGNAQVSEKHAGFIVNRGGATSADVLSLIDYIKNELLKKFGVEIECEIRYVV